MDVYSPRKKRGLRQQAGVFALIFFALAGAGTGLWAYSIVGNLPDPERLTERAVIQSTKIYDRTGEILLYEIHGEEKRTVIPLEEIPENVRRATIAAEDARFYDHFGIDFRGILRAFLKDVKDRDIRQGGSTITQQLIKNSLLTSEQTFTRKFREVVLAIAVESKYSKDEILELYLNQIPYGSNAYGIASAAQTYFAKNARDLTLAEAAHLAALPKAPSYYSPYGSHKEELAGRKNWILERMAGDGLISSEEAEEAKKEAPEFVTPELRAPHFVFYVREQLNEKFGEEFVERGGLRVTTTLDWELQQSAEKAVKEVGERNKELVGAYNAALAAIDPQSGEVLAMVGSRDFFAKPEPEDCTPGINCKFDPHVNVSRRLRQPGSAFKPFVYATAFKKGYTPETVVFDVPTEFNPLCDPDGTPKPHIDISKYQTFECYHPQNYDEKFRGPVTLRQSLAQSLNVPSAKVLYLAGIGDSLQTAEDLGISTLTEPDRYGLSLVLGGAEVSLLEMTSAFGVFAAEGILHPKTSILRIETAEGTLLEEKKEASIPVLDTEIARILNDLLSDNEARIPVFSPQSSLYFPGRQVAAKTGTTQDFRDAWTIGYTPTLAVGVWTGNSDNSSMDKSALSIMVSGPIWHQFFNYVFSRSAPEAFVPPETREVSNPVFNGSYRGEPIIKIDTVSGKRATEYTPQEFVEERGFGKIRSLLALVDRANPLGAPPGNPEEDPQFKNWQAAIDEWLEEHPLPQLLPPQELDDVHTPEKLPRVMLISPAPDSLTASNVSSITFGVNAAWPLREASLFIDDALIVSKITSSNSLLLTFSLSEPLSPGEHTIKITAYDTVGNRSTLEKLIEIK